MFEQETFPKVLKIGDTYIEWPLERHRVQRSVKKLVIPIAGSDHPYVKRLYSNPTSLQIGGKFLLSASFSQYNKFRAFLALDGDYEVMFWDGSTQMFMVDGTTVNLGKWLAGVPMAVDWTMQLTSLGAHTPTVLTLDADTDDGNQNPPPGGGGGSTTPPPATPVLVNPGDQVIQPGEAFSLQFMVTPVTSVAAQTAAITVTGLDDPSLVFLSYNPTARTISGTAPDTVVARSPRTITATVAGGNTVTFTIAIQAVRNPEITGLPRFIAVLTGTSLPRNALSYSVQGDDYLPIVSFTGMPAGLAESQATSSVDQYRVEGNINGTLANSFRAGRVLQVTLTATGAGLTSTHPFGICIFGDHLTIRGDRDTPILNNIPHHALPSGRPYQAFLAGLTIKNVPGDLTLTVTEKPDWLSELTTISQTINGTGNNVRFNLASVVLDGDTPAVTVQTTYRVSYRVDSTDGRTASHSFNIRVTPVSN